MIPFRTLCSKLRAAIKAMPADQRAALDQRIAGLIERGLHSALRVNAADFLKLCARVGIDPMTGADSGATIVNPGELSFDLIGAGLVMQQHLLGIEQQEAALRIGVSRQTLWRLERGMPVSAETVIAACEFIGVHPFGYMQNEKRRAA